jgi:hypothetical protein
MADRTLFPDSNGDPETARADAVRAHPECGRVEAGQDAATDLSRRDFLHAAGIAGAGLALSSPEAAKALTRAEANTGPVQTSEFAVAFEDGAITSLRYSADSFDTDYVVPGTRFGDVIVRFRQGSGEWRSLETSEASADRTTSASPDGREHGMVVSASGADVPEVEVDFVVDDSTLRWRVTVRNPTDRSIEVGDLAVPLPINLNLLQENGEWVAPPLKRHGLVSGAGSFFYWMRSNSIGPYLVMTVDEGTALEYWEASDGYRVFVHSAAAGAVAEERGCDWRQPNTSLVLSPGEERAYGFTFRWADDYDHVRQVLVEQGLVDVQVVPGITLPSDLAARIALRTNQGIRSVEAEYPDETSVRSLGRRGEAEIFEIRFSRLGENRLSLRFGEDRIMYLEFFSTEPLGTLIQKRGAFIAAHQWRDPALWYDGLFAEWAMDTQVLLGPDNPDRIEGWRRYALPCDDPGLGKPAYLAAKNAEFPVQAEVEALDYYIDNFVWGGLQRTTEETFSYGI